MSDLLDFLIRNQVALFSLTGTVAVVALALLAILRRSDSVAVQSERATAEAESFIKHANRDTRRRRPSSRLPTLWLLVAFVGVSLAFWSLLGVPTAVEIPGLSESSTVPRWLRSLPGYILSLVAHAAVVVVAGALTIRVYRAVGTTAYWKVSGADRYRAARRVGTVIGIVLALAIAVWPRVTGSLIIPPTAGLEEPAVVRRGTQNHKLLVLLHGWNGDASGTWNQFPQLLKNDSRLKEFDLWMVEYPTVLARRNLRIRQMSRWLNELMVINGRYEQYTEIYVIAHSMGGLIARGMLLENRLANNNMAYKSVISIASPYRGADIARLLSTLGLSRGYAEDLRPGSEMLDSLRDDWNSFRDRPHGYCLTSPHDAVVSEDSAIYQCNEYLRYPQWGHSEMVKPESTADPRYQVPVERVLRIASEHETTQPR